MGGQCADVTPTARADGEERCESTRTHRGSLSLPCLSFLARRNLRPFDRHDWYVNRCGKEVKYVIDYYSFEQADPETGETSIDYFIDARPAPTLSGMYDRARLAFGKWKRGEKIW